jgi:hypothetical protein
MTFSRSILLLIARRKSATQACHRNVARLPLVQVERADLFFSLTFLYTVPLRSRRQQDIWRD